MNAAVGSASLITPVNVSRKRKRSVGSVLQPASEMSPVVAASRPVKVRAVGKSRVGVQPKVSFAVNPEVIPVVAASRPVKVRAVGKPPVGVQSTADGPVVPPFLSVATGSRQSARGLAKRFKLASKASSAGALISYVALSAISVSDNAPIKVGQFLIIRWSESSQLILNVGQAVSITEDSVGVQWYMSPDALSSKELWDWTWFPTYKDINSGVQQLSAGPTASLQLDIYDVELSLVMYQFAALTPQLTLPTAVCAFMMMH